MKRLRQFLCALGFHGWKYDVLSDAAGTSPYRQCQRPGCAVFQWLEP